MLAVLVPAFVAADKFDRGSARLARGKMAACIIMPNAWRFVCIFKRTATNQVRAENALFAAAARLMAHKPSCMLKCKPGKRQPLVGVSAIRRGVAMTEAAAAGLILRKHLKNIIMPPIVTNHRAISIISLASSGAAAINSIFQGEAR